MDHKHKYLALLLDVMTTYETRFPNAPGFHTIRLNDGDLSTFLEQIKSMALQEQEIFSLYFKAGHPISFIGELIGKGSIEIASQIAIQRKFIKTCVGNAVERDASFENIRAAKDRGTVLDTYTAWTAHLMGLFPILRTYFNRVAIAQSALDELRQWRERYEGVEDQPLMTIGCPDGEHVRTEIPQGELKSIQSSITLGIEAFRNQLEVLPVVAPRELSEIEASLIEIAPHGVLEPVFIAKAESLLLLSDDMHLRNLAREIHQVPGSWLQTVLLICLDEGVIEFDEYTEAVVGISFRRHDYITLITPVLLRIAELDLSGGMENVKAVTQFLAIEAADFASHWSVLWDSLKKVWRTELPELRQRQLAGLLLERIACLFTKQGKLQEGFQQLLMSSEIGADLRAYIGGWTKGHFI